MNLEEFRQYIKEARVEFGDTGAYIVTREPDGKESMNFREGANADGLALYRALPKLIIDHNFTKEITKKDGTVEDVPATAAEVTEAIWTRIAWIKLVTEAWQGFFSGGEMNKGSATSSE